MTTSAFFVYPKAIIASTKDQRSGSSESQVVVNPIVGLDVERGAVSARTRASMLPCASYPVAFDSFGTIACALVRGPAVMTSASIVARSRRSVPFFAL